MIRLSPLPPRPPTLPRALVLTLLLGSAWLLGTTPTRADEVRIAVVGPLSGPARSLGNELSVAIASAVSVFNEDEGLLGEPIVVEYFDDACDIERAESVAREILDSFRPTFVIGHCPALVERMARFYDRNDVVYFAPWVFGMEPPVSDKSSSFRFLVRPEQFAARAAQLAFYWSDEAPVGIITSESPSEFERALIASFRAQAETLSGRIVFEESAKNTETVLALIASKEPETLFFTTSDPSEVRRVLGAETPPADVIMMGQTDVADVVWLRFWSWWESRENRGSLDVLAPAAFAPEGPTQLVSRFEELGRSIYDERRIPTHSQMYAMTALELAVTTIRDSGTADPEGVAAALREDSRATLLGRLRANSHGAVEGIEVTAYRAESRWSPHTALRSDLMREMPEDASAAAVEDDGGGSEPPDETPPGEPVYNVRVDPKQASSPLILVPDQPTTVEFYIGPQALDSVTAIPVSRTLESLAKGDPVELTVTLYAYAAKANTFQQKKITYVPDKRSSDKALFSFVPDVSLVMGPGGRSDLVFVVDMSGFEIDVLKIPTLIGMPDTMPDEDLDAPAKLAMEPFEDGDIKLPDLVLSIAPPGTGGKLTVVVRPIHEGLRTAIRNELGDPDREFWTLRAGMTKNDLDDLVASGYKMMRALALQNNERLQENYASAGIDLELGPGGGILDFDPSDRETMLSSLRSSGALLYDRLLLRGDDRLERAMSVIDGFSAGHPLRVRILAADVYAPWQILYPEKSGTIDPHRFWGFRYELGTLQIVDQAQGRSRTLLERPEPGEIVFAAWRGNTPGDTVAARAKLLVDHLKKKIGDGIRFITSGNDLRTILEAEARSVKLIYAYGHGSSGNKIVVLENPDGEPETFDLPTDIGACFVFADGDVLLPSTFDLFDPGERLRFFESQPFVILNACETGTSGTRTSHNNGFVGAFTRVGARAIFVTEAPVWSNFAYHFGRDLMDELLRGSEARSAIRTVRLRHLEKWNNPLGLMYALYGNPAAHFQPPS